MSLDTNKIQGKGHNIGTYRKNKVLLSCYDYKKYTLEDQYSRLWYIHKSII